MYIWLPVVKVLFDVNVNVFAVEEALSIVVEAAPVPNCTLKNCPAPAGSVFAITDFRVNAAGTISFLVVVPACHWVVDAITSKLRGMQDWSTFDVTAKRGPSDVAPVPPFAAVSAFVRVSDPAVSTLGMVTPPFELMENAAVVDVATAVDVAIYSEFAMVLNVHELLAVVPSASASCGAVDVAMVNGAKDGDDVPIRRWPVLNISIRIFDESVPFVVHRKDDEALESVDEESSKFIPPSLAIRKPSLGRPTVKSGSL